MQKTVGREEHMAGVVSSGSSVLSGKLYYYYRQLPVTERAAYDALLRGLMEMKEEIRIPGGGNFDLISRLIDLIRDDHPELFWVRGTGTGKRLGGILSYLPDYTMSRTVKEDRERRIRAVVSAFLKSAHNCRTDLECLEAAFLFLVKNVSYVDGSPDSQNICSALLNHKSVCAGYSRALQYLMHQMGRECLYVSGESLKGGRHAWNIVNLGGKYYHTDVTYADRDFSGSADRKNGISAGLDAEYAYLCMSDEEIQQDRRTIVKGGIRLPACTSKEMSWYRRHNLFFFNAEDAWTQIGWFLSRGKNSWCCQFASDQAYKEFVQDISRKRFSNLVMEKKRIRRVTTYTQKNDCLRCVAGWVGCS